ncbi:hypothetical protein EGW08_010143 [Elysia chlorotica]|uniref:Uncharacterized protein n=1 Tax=Elysia chlorotica TaxID=188477 RepID=A0A3S1BEW6_ELYCH|nr:hypothetical protein EGW08_010143 [Elysia chlorotica]
MMASNGSDASSPLTSTPNVEQAATKTESAPAVDPKAEQSLKMEAAPVKQVAEDLSVDSKAPKEKENSSAKNTVPDAPKAAETKSEKSSPVDDTKMEVDPIPEIKTDNPAADNNTSDAKSENTTNGTDNQQPTPAVPTPKESKDNATNSASTHTATPASASSPAPASTPIALAPSAPAAVEPKLTNKEDPVALKQSSPTLIKDTGIEKKEEAKSEKKTSNADESKSVDAPGQPPASAPATSKPTTPPKEEANKAAAPSPDAAEKLSEAAPLAGTKSTTQQAKSVPPVATVAPMPKVASSSKNTNGDKPSTGKHAADSRPDGDAPPEKKAKSTPGSSASSKTGSGSSASSVTPAGGKTPQQILEYMNKTFEHRRRIITKQMPTIPELQKLYPDLFMHKQLLTEFQRITKIDIDQKIQEFCVRFATAVIEMARNKKGAAPVIARWEKAQKENHSLKQYWDMMTALCLLPLHFGENFADMVQEIGEDEEVVAQGKIVPVLVARGNVYRTDEFFLIAENTIVQEFEEFTIALASLYSSYWVFNMVYPESIENTYNYIQRCIVRQKEPGSIPAVCRNFTKALQKWNKEKEGK